jgi:selenocysteine lyase/cysteine desulfurase
MAPELIPSQRHRFDIPRDIAYLNCAYMSPLMTQAMTAGERGLRRKGQPWTITAEHFFDESEAVRSLFAKLINADPDGVAIIPAASYGIAIAANNLSAGRDAGRSRSVLHLAEQFPSHVYAWREFARAQQLALNVVQRPGDHDWTRAILGQIDEHTAVAALPNCHWTDGGLVDLDAVGRRCRETDTALVLDLTQSAGALPFDTQAVRPDFAIAAGYKWLLGPYSLGFVYVDERWRDGKPLEHNWISRLGSEDFAGLVEYEDAFQPGARRYDVGERANFALMPMLRCALDQLLDWGVANIYHTLSTANAEIVARATPLGLRAVDDRWRAGHFLGLRFDTGLPSGLLETLADENVYLSVRGDSMRVTPHLYNDTEDLDRMFRALERVV